MIRIVSFAVALVFGASLGFAQGSTKNNLGTVAPDVVKKYEDFRKRRAARKGKLPPRIQRPYVEPPSEGDPIEVEEEPAVMEGRMESLEDGVVLISQPVDKNRMKILKRMGARIVTKAEDARHHTIFNGRYYVGYPVKDLDVKTEQKMQVDRGEDVEAKLEVTPHGRYRVSSLAVKKGSASQK